MVLSLQRLTEFYRLEIECGLAGLGNYSLRPGLQPVALSTFAADHDVADPESIVGAIRSGTLTAQQDRAADTLSAQSTAPSSPPTPSPSTSSAVTTQAVSETQQEDTTQVTKQERAARMIAAGKISLDARLHVFTVDGTLEPPVVRLFPSTSCSCPATCQCYHVLAAKMAIGLPDDSAPPRAVNLTHLRRNKRKRADKTSGRKRPRPNDVEVVAAGDADPAVTEHLAARITSNGAADAAAPAVVVPESELCGSCMQVDPPRSRSRRPQRVVPWIECEQCKVWYHTACVVVVVVVVIA